MDGARVVWEYEMWSMKRFCFLGVYIYREVYNLEIYVDFFVVVVKNIIRG